MFAELSLKKLVQWPSLRGVSRLRINGLWNHAIVLSQNRISVNAILPSNTIRHLKQVDDHVPLATVADQITREVSNEAIIEWTAGFLDRQLKVIIGLVEFIPEK